MVFGASTSKASCSPALMKPSHPSLYRPTKIHHLRKCRLAEALIRSKMLSMPSSGGRSALMRVSAGRSDAFRAAPSHPGVRNLSSARRLSPDWGRKLYYDGWLPVPAWGAGARK